MSRIVQELDREERREVLKRYIFLPKDGFFVPFEKWTELATPITEILGAFKANLVSAVTVGSIPVTLTHNAIHANQFSHLCSAERIRVMALAERECSELTNEEMDKQAYVRAVAIMEQRQNNDEFIKRTYDAVLRSLHARLKDEQFADAPDELLRQVTVMIWGALESLATDIAIATINTRPALASRVLATDTFRKSGAVRACHLKH